MSSSGQQPWRVSIRDNALMEVESGAGYKRLRMQRLNNDVGAFSFELPGSHVGVSHLVQPGAGIVVRAEDTNRVEFSGFVLDLYFAESRSSQKGDITAVGVCDNILLAKEFAFPEPETDIPTGSNVTSLDLQDTRTGAAETVLKAFVADNIGPAALIARRQYPFLNIPASVGLGDSGTWRGRWQTLLELCQQIAAFGSLSFRIVQSAPGELTLEVWTPATVPQAKFSIEAGNLRYAVATFRAPDVSEIIIGGGGEGSARVFTRRNASGLGSYGRRIVKFMDRTSTVVYNELQQAGREELAQGVATSGVTLDPIQRADLRYGIDYSVGDIVSAVVQGVEIVDTVEEVLIEHEAGKPETIRPTVGARYEEETPIDIPTFRAILRNLTDPARR